MMAVPCLSSLAQIPMTSRMQASCSARSPAPELSSNTSYHPEIIAQSPSATDPPASLNLPSTSPRNTGAHAASPPDDANVFEDPHSLLPRFTRIRVIGNNRTKSQLVGQLGLVRNATGLGGWHRVVLDIGGEEVRLQRNALSVVSRPKGDESDFSDDDVEDVQQEEHAAVLLPRERRRRAPRPSSEHASNERRVSARQASVVVPRINLQCLDATALKRYRQHYQLTDVGDTATREQLVTAVGRHFMQQSVDEVDTIERFINAAYSFAQGPR